MSMNGLCGLHGNGKTHEAVRTAILPAIMSGRNVVTNIDGINEELISAYLVGKRGADPALLGRVIYVTNDDVMKMTGFFPIQKEPDAVTVVNGGDLVVIDEAWQFWGESEKIRKDHMEFFRMHRHYIHSKTGVACDIVLLVQSIGDLHRSVKRVLTLTSRMTKLKIVGANSRFRVDLFLGGTDAAKAKFDSYQEAYDPEIFDLYKSYSGVIQGVEVDVDSRLNILKNPKLFYYGGGIILCIAFVIWAGYDLYQENFVKVKKAADSRAVVSSVSNDVHSSKSVPVKVDSNGEAYRLAGHIFLKGEKYNVVIDADGRMHYVSPQDFVGSGLMEIGTFQGKRVALWTGSMPTVAGSSRVIKGVLK